MKSIALIALFVALVGLTVASDTDINFNFEGMIPAAGAGYERPKAHRLNVYEVSTTDVTTPGFEDEKSPLMSNVWANQLWNPSKTEVMGYNVGQCTVTPAINNIGPLHEVCQVTLFFNNGEDQLAVSGAVTSESMPQTISVVGGTGEYLGAYGSCTFQPFENLDVHYVCDFFTPN